MEIYSDYANWKFENFDLVNELINIKSKIISRFTHVIDVVEYLYKKKMDNKDTFIEDEELIFDTAFNYLHDHFNTIKMIYSSIFNSDIKEMDKISKTINLLLYTNDFQQELMNTSPDNHAGYKNLCDFEEKILKSIEKKQEADDGYFGLLNDITSTLFEDYYGINEIMYDICLELGILVEDTDDGVYDI